MKQQQGRRRAKRGKDKIEAAPALAAAAL